MHLFSVSRALLPLVLAAVALAPSALAKKKILIYSYTQGFHHYSIPTAVETIKELGKNNDPGYDSVHSDDPDDFEKKGWLDQFDALVFVSVSGKALSSKGADRMREYIEAGGGYMGIHEACDALNDYHWYGRLAGAYFDYHPEICHATLVIEDKSHPSVAHLGKTWKVYDEMYNYLSDPRDYGKQLVLSVDEESYNDPVTSVKDRARMQGSPHPIAWYKEGGQLDYNPHVKVGGGTDPTKKEKKSGKAGTGGDGRSFYTALGHTNKTWHDDDFQGHILGALNWVLESPSLKSNNANAPADAVGSDYEAPEVTSTSKKDSAASLTGKNRQALPTSTVVNGQVVPFSSGHVNAAQAGNAGASAVRVESASFVLLAASLAAAAVALTL